MSNQIVLWCVKYAGIVMGYVWQKYSLLKSWSNISSKITITNIALFVFTQNNRIINEGKNVCMQFQFGIRFLYTLNKMTSSKVSHRKQIWYKKNVETSSNITEKMFYDCLIYLMFNKMRISFSKKKYPWFIFHDWKLHCINITYTYAQNNDQLRCLCLNMKAQINNGYNDISNIKGMSMSSASEITRRYRYSLEKVKYIHIWF